MCGDIVSKKASMTALLGHHRWIVGLPTPTSFGMLSMVKSVTLVRSSIPFVANNGGGLPHFSVGPPGVSSALSLLTFMEASPFIEARPLALKASAFLRLRRAGTLREGAAQVAALLSRRCRVQPGECRSRSLCGLTLQENCSYVTLRHVMSCALLARLVQRSPW